MTTLHIAVTILAGAAVLYRRKTIWSTTYERAATINVAMFATGAALIIAGGDDTDMLATGAGSILIFTGWALMLYCLIGRLNVPRDELRQMLHAKVTTPIHLAVPVMAGLTLKPGYLSAEHWWWVSSAVNTSANGWMACQLFWVLSIIYRDDLRSRTVAAFYALAKLAGIGICAAAAAHLVIAGKPLGAQEPVMSIGLMLIVSLNSTAAILSHRDASRRQAARRRD